MVESRGVWRLGHWLVVASCWSPRLRLVRLSRFAESRFVILTASVSCPSTLFCLVNIKKRSFLTSCVFWFGLQIHDLWYRLRNVCPHWLFVTFVQVDARMSSTKRYWWGPDSQEVGERRSLYLRLYSVTTTVTWFCIRMSSDVTLPQFLLFGKVTRQCPSATTAIDDPAIEDCISRVIPNWKLSGGMDKTDQLRKGVLTCSLTDMTAVDWALKAHSLSIYPYVALATGTKYCRHWLQKQGFFLGAFLHRRGSICDRF